jgi:sortase A
MIFGRSVTYGAPFRGLTRLRPNDVITATTAQGVFDYRVDRVRHAGDPLPQPPAGDASRLTLVTSASSGWRSGWAPDHVVYLDATLTGKVQPAPTGRPTALSRSARPMRGDSSALMTLVFWLQAGVLVSGGLAWAWFRWGRWQAWLAGLPVLMLVLWGASGAALRLLPNLI